ncbi:MAG: hypothetical protein M0C28_39610 [Candidatus Moduliflexus flocculans]|nr:hypothetical protein [Candidatus Moduliflexus flocculans]
MLTDAKPPYENELACFAPPTIQRSHRRRRALCRHGLPLSCAQPDPNWLDHDRNRPLPPVVTPATPSTPDQAGKAPSDAVVLFDGKDLSQWCAMDGSPSKWIVQATATWNA